MEVKKQKSFGMGVVGAVVGGLIGALSIILFGQLGVISAISGLILAFCTLKGFELLGGKLERNALIVCVVIMLVVPYFADRLNWAIAYYQVFQENNLAVSFGDCFKYVHDFISVDELEGDYIKDLLFVYAFAALGGFTMVRQAFKQQNAVVEEAPVEEAPVEEIPAEETPVDDNNTNYVNKL